jgi:hypothetical protein
VNRIGREKAGKNGCCPHYSLLIYGEQKTQKRLAQEKQAKKLESQQGEQKQLPPAPIE